MPASTGRAAGMHKELEGDAAVSQGSDPFLRVRVIQVAKRGPGWQDCAILSIVYWSKQRLSCKPSNRS